MAVKVVRRTEFVTVYVSHRVEAKPLYGNIDKLVLADEHKSVIIANYGILIEPLYYVIDAVTKARADSLGICLSNTLADAKKYTKNLHWLKNPVYLEVEPIGTGISPDFISTTIHPVPDYYPKEAGRHWYSLWYPAVHVVRVIE